MARHLLVVQTNPVAGRDEEYNTWYDTVHLREVLGIDEFVAAERFEVAAALPGDEPPQQRYLALYEIETDDIAAALARLRAAGPSLNISSALDRTSVQAFAVVSRGERLTQTSS